MTQRQRQQRQQRHNGNDRAACLPYFNAYGAFARHDEKETALPIETLF